MEIRLLGPLEVVVGSQPCPIPGAAERELLARLALSPGTVVAADRLIDDLWGDRLPADAANALQTRVSKLRRALAKAGADGEALATQRPGYVLRVPRAAVDALRFADLLAEARQAAQRDAPAQAHAAYAEALALWRGPALTDFSSTWATAEAARLEELQLAATEERIDVALALGRHAELVVELEALVSAHPLRERLRAKLMLALYRSGRQADALAAFGAAREVLAEELGIDPGEELQRLEAAVLRQDPALSAPARAAATARIPLPLRRTSFVGRDREVEAVTRALRDSALVTLVGPGGAGKTTLAIEAARLLEDRFPDGGAFVALSGVSDPDLVPQAVAEALELPAQSQAPAPERLVSALRSRRSLLILDNCEHLAEAAADLAETLLATCPDVHLLATSREPLGIDGETQLGLAPLPIPAPDWPVETVAANPAVRLFADRAAAVNPDFKLGPDNLDSVVRICTALDGMPLAIELAAARAKMLRPADIAERLDDRFALLSTGRRTAEARQQTLRAAVDWSHELLTVNEQRLYRRLSVFRGGWTLDAAEDVCSGDGLDHRDVLELLTRLVDRSLVVADTDAGRFRMLETLRHYGLDRLAEAGEIQAVRTRFVRYFVDLAERSEVQLRGRQQATWLARLRSERDNLYQALGWCTAEPERFGEEGLRLLGGLGWWWYLGRQDEGRDWAERILGSMRNGSPGAAARAHRAASLVWRPGGCVVHPNPHSAEQATALLGAAEEAGDADLVAYGRTFLAVEAIGSADSDEAAQLLEAAQRTFVGSGDAWGQALVAFVRSEIAFVRATLPFDRALLLSEEAAEAFGSLGDRWGLSAVLAHRAHALERSGAYDHALEVSQRVIAMARELGLLITVQWMLPELAHLHLMFGRIDEAEPLLAEARDMALGMGGGPGVPTSEIGYGLVARLRGDHGAARDHFTRAAAEAEAQGMTAQVAVALSGAGHAALETGDAEAASQLHQQALDVARRMGSAGGTALALEGLAGVAASCGDGRRAALLLGAAAGTRERIGWPPNPLQQGDIERATAAARALVGAGEFDAALAEGRMRDLDHLPLPTAV